MLGLFNILVNIVLYCMSIKLVELLDYLDIVGFSKLHFHFEIHDRLSKIRRELFDLHAEESAVQVRFSPNRR